MRNEKGFALVTAILAIMILMALGIMAITISTGDLKISSRVVGEKKAMSAAEAGLHSLMSTFDPGGTVSTDWVQVDPATDAASQYRIDSWGRPDTGPEMLPLAGYSIGGGQQWGQRRYVATVTGENTNYKSSVQIDTGMGYGPIEISTMLR
jgi:hypothetical protein